MKLLTIDFETYYDQKYSLSKMTTEAYIRDPRFEVIGVSIKVENTPAIWYSGPHVDKLLAGIDFSDKAVLAHNTAFDGAILAWRYGVKPKMWLDTLSMARAGVGQIVGNSLKALVQHFKLGEKGDEVVRALGKRRKEFTKAELDAYGSYCTTDTELTYKLFKRLMKDFPPKELQVIDMVLRLYTEPYLQLNGYLLDKHITSQMVAKTTLMEDLDLPHMTEDEIKTMLMSNDKFAAFLEALDVDVPMKTSKANGKPTWALSKSDTAFTKLLEHDNPRVSKAVAARLGVKSTIEYTRALSMKGISERGPLPVMLNYYGAHTGRFSGGDKMNLQNLPRGGTLRKAVQAPPGMKLVACDLSQIEARIVAYVAGQTDLVEAFAEGRDIYSEFASEIYLRKVTKENKLERFVGKTSILGLGYGMGPEKFQGTLAIGQGGLRVHIDLDEAQRIVQLYRTKNWRIEAFWRNAKKALVNMAAGNKGTIMGMLDYDGEIIRLPNGMPLRYNMLTDYGSGGLAYVSDMRQFRHAMKRAFEGGEQNGDGLTRIYGGKCVENIVQALARIVIVDHMLTIGRRYKVVLQVHDEIVILVNEDEAEEAMAFVVDVMSQEPAWAPGLPVACEAGIGDNYGECK